MKSFKLTAVSTAVAVATLACSVPAVAADTAPPSQIVKFADLNLSSQSDAQILHSRLKTAAWQVCRESTSGAAAGGFLIFRCVRAALDEAVKDVNRPSLTAVHAGGAAANLTARR